MSMLLATTIVLVWIFAMFFISKPILIVTDEKLAQVFGSYKGSYSQFSTNSDSSHSDDLKLFCVSKFFINDFIPKVYHLHTADLIIRVDNKDKRVINSVIVSYNKIINDSLVEQTDTIEMKKNGNELIGRREVSCNIPDSCKVTICYDNSVCRVVNYIKN